MSTREPADRPAGNKAVPWTKKFRRSVTPIRPTPEQLRRQDSILQCAWRSLGTSTPVIAFLNTHNEQLGGQPLHVALESDEGLVRVQGLLAEIALETAERPS